MTNRRHSPEIPDSQEGLFPITDIPESQRGLTSTEISEIAGAIGLAAVGATPPEHRVSEAQAELGGGTRVTGPKKRPVHIRKPKDEPVTPPPTHGTIGVDPSSPPDVRSMREVMARARQEQQGTDR